ncbi:MAG: hypothetical protein J5I92_03915 [Thiogranum sp.]|nr:hypothetical protein [Thiogranum sp.]
MTEILIIGLGSEHGADRAGWQAIDALQRSDFATRFPPGLVALLKIASPTELYQHLEPCRFAILIDAMPGPPGRLTWLSADDIRQRDDLFSVHGIGVGEMLGLLETLPPQPPRVQVLGIGVEAGSAASPLDAGRAAALCLLRGRVEQAVLRFLAASRTRQPSRNER